MTDTQETQANAPAPAPARSLWAEDDPWAHIPDDEDGSTWERHQDEGTFPSWLQ